MQNGATSYISSTGIEPSTSGTAKESLKTQFITREGIYKQMTVSDQLSRPYRVPTSQGGPNPAFNAPVKVSFARLIPKSHDVPSSQTDSNGELTMHNSEEAAVMERICFNIGRELFVYDFRSANSSFDWSKPVDKRIYKGTYPTCHDFNSITMTPTSCNLLVGFSAGQIQLIDPFQKEFQNSRLFNEDRLIDKTPVTCLKWLPNQSQLFAASHSSGSMYIYNEEFNCAPNAPSYQLLKQGEGFIISNVKSRSQHKNPLQKWTVGKGAINQFEFGGVNSSLLATVSQDGFLRVFKYATMELMCYMRSYFGGLLCLSWSPDYKLIATGGEDDLLTVYSVQEKRVLCRGQGHKSWISQVAFDPYTTGSSVSVSGSNLRSNSINMESVSSTEELRSIGNGNLNSLHQKSMRASNQRQCGIFDDNGSRLNSFENNSVVYRIGTVSADTQLCFWDVADELLGSTTFTTNGVASSSGINQNHGTLAVENNLVPESVASPSTKDRTLKESKTSRLKKLHKRGLSFGNKHGNQTDRWSRANIPLNRSSNQGPSTSAQSDESSDRVGNLFGTPLCPKMDQIPLIEPLICKKISHERLTVLCFREDCLVTGCQEGFICTWARPNRASRL